MHTVHDPPREAAALDGASKVFGAGDAAVVALAPTTLSLRAGELTLVLGPSGSGKTTLLSLLGCVLAPTAGRIRIAGEEVTELPPAALAAVRLRRIGFVFQSFNLLAPLTAEENVALPLQLLGVPAAERRARALTALDAVGMTPHRGRRPSGLSGGQQQRVAIARALVTDPPLVLCDEPTAALDARSAGRVMDELATLADRGKAVVVVTHDPRLDGYARRVLRVENGVAAETPSDGARQELVHVA